MPLDPAECPHRRVTRPESFTNGQGAVRPFCSCALADTAIGAQHGFPSAACATQCLANRGSYPDGLETGSFVELMAHTGLATRIRDGRADDDPTSPWREGTPHHLRKETAIAKSIACGMAKDRVADGLLHAVARGFAAEKAIEIARLTGLVDP